MLQLRKLTFLAVLLGLCDTNEGQLTMSSPGQRDKAQSDINNILYNPAIVTWQEALSSCQQTGNGSLVPITAQTDVQSLISGLRRRFHPDAVWVRNYRVFNKAFTPPNGVTLNGTEKCVGLTITSISTTDVGHVVRYELSIQSMCEAGHGALCLCQSDHDIKSLKVKRDPHSWMHYHRNNCGNQCRLWSPPYDGIFPENLRDVIGSGNVTLKGLSTELVVSQTYWINILALLNEETSTEKGGIVDCGYIPSFSDELTFGVCDEKRAFICENSTGGERDVSTVGSVDSTSVVLSHDGYNNTQPHSQASNGLTVAEYTGAIIGGVCLLVGFGISILLWLKCRHRRVSSKDDSLPKSGRSFVRQKSSSGIEEDCATPNNENRITLYAKIDPSCVRDTLPRLGRHGNNQSEVLPTNQDGYLTMDGFKNATFDSEYDVIGPKGKGDNRDTSSSIYNVLNEADAESVYDTTLDRHPSRRVLISESAYDHIDMSASMAIDGEMCSSIGNENGQYSRLRQHNQLQNPTYDSSVIQ